MKIYTKGGDGGETGLYGGSRVSKDDLRIRAYGTLDELNAVLGMVLSEPDLESEVRNTLCRLQGELFQLGAELAVPRGKNVNLNLIDLPHVVLLENGIDAMEGKLQPLRSFILPGGLRAASLIHFARTVSRRAEREVVTLNRGEPLRAGILQYLNRLSDFLFVLARYVNHRGQVADVPWISPKD